MGLMEEFGAWLDNKRRLSGLTGANAAQVPDALWQLAQQGAQNVKQGVTDPVGLLSNVGENLGKFRTGILSAGDASRSVMPEVRQQGVDELADYGASLADVVGGAGAIKGKAAKASATTGDGFDAWRKSIWDDVKNGKFHPEEIVPDNADILKGKAPRKLYRAMSDAEWKSAQRTGAFRPLRPNDPDLYVTADPDRLAGGAYGAKGGGRIVEFDPVPVKKATGRLIDVNEISASEIPLSNVRRVWKWDAKIGDHVLDQPVEGLLAPARTPTKYELAHAEAQRNAALPVEQGGLGLRPDNTAMERAKAMGFDTDAYHGKRIHGNSKESIQGMDQFEPQRRQHGGEGDTFTLNPKTGQWEGKATTANTTFLAESPGLASEYAGAPTWFHSTSPMPSGKRPVVYPLKVRTADMMDANMNADTVRLPNGEVIEQYFPFDERIWHEANSTLIPWARDIGAKGVKIQGVKDSPFGLTSEMPQTTFAVFDPSQIRSRFAAFDPKKKNSRDLLASMGLLGLLGMGAYGDEQQ